MEYGYWQSAYNINFVLALVHESRLIVEPLWNPRRYCHEHAMCSVFNKFFMINSTFIAISKKYRARTDTRLTTHNKESVCIFLFLSVQLYKTEKTPIFDFFLKGNRYYLPKLIPSVEPIIEFAIIGVFNWYFSSDQVYITIFKCYRWATLDSNWCGRD